MAQTDAELSLVFVDDSQIADLNERYLKRVGPTNVISFPMDSDGIPGVQPKVLGDVVISVDTARREAEEEGVDLEEKIDWLLVHGVLHLLGYDHEKAKDSRVMFRMEEEMLQLLKGE